VGGVIHEDLQGRCGAAGQRRGRAKVPDERVRRNDLFETSPPVLLQMCVKIHRTVDARVSRRNFSTPAVF